MIPTSSVLLCDTGIPRSFKLKLAGYRQRSQRVYVHLRIRREKTNSEAKLRKEATLAIELVLMLKVH